MHYSQTQTLLRFDSPLGKDTLIPVRLSGKEEMTRGFSFRLELFSSDGNLDPDKLLGKSVTVGIRYDQGKHRYINAIVTRFSCLGLDNRVYRYEAELRPWTEKLELCRNCRIFQNKTVGEIIQLVCNDRGLNDHKLRLRGTYPKLTYVVQYQESDLAFITRLMEEFGLFSFFEHDNQRHTLIVADDPDAYPKTTGLKNDSIAFLPDGLHGWQQQDVLTKAAIETRLITDKLAVDDYNFETSTTDLKAQTQVRNGKLERYIDAPGYQNKSDGTKIAKLMIEAEEAPETLLSATSLCRVLMPGHRFKLTGMHHKKANTTYVVRHIEHEATHETYTNQIEAQPTSTMYRPERRTPRPVIAGTQTARVTGPKDKEIWVDKHGRIKVQFHWDRDGKSDENTSCWIRVAQGWAGKQFGSMFIPRIGMEVVVSFVNGDPDRPLVTGCVYNGQNKPPYALPANQTRSTIKTDSSPKASGFNELRFEDKKDKEEIYLHAQKNLLTEVIQDRTTLLKKGHDKVEIKEGNRTFKVSKGNETHEIAGTRKTTVGKAETHNDKANFTHNVKGNYTLKVNGSMTVDVKGAINIKSAKSITLKSSLATKIQSGTAMTCKSGTAMTLDCGTSMKVKAAMSIQTKAGMAIKTSAGSAIEHKSGGTYKSQAGGMMTNKAGGMHQAEGGAMMMIKGAMVKIN